MNASILTFYNSGLTQRRLAIALSVNRKTIVRKFRFLAIEARKAHAQKLEARTSSVRWVQFDEMETFEHTKLKPVSIAVAVEAKSGDILAITAEPSSYKGPLAPVALKKYGPRTDRSGLGITRVLESLATVVTPDVLVVTDGSSKYPNRIRKILPAAIHRAVLRVPPKLGHRRRNADDALAALNVTFAKLRSDLSRLSRRTWVTTKKITRLEEHLALYVAWNNGYVLTA